MRRMSPDEESPPPRKVLCFEQGALARTPNRLFIPEAYLLIRLEVADEISRVL